MIEFKKHSIVRYISDYCLENKIKLIVRKKNKNGYFDSLKLILCATNNKCVSLSSRLFIIAHEYGHAVQYLKNINYTPSDEFIYNNIRRRIPVKAVERNKVIKNILKNEFHATELALELMNKFNYSMPKKSLQKIQYNANLQLFITYFTLKLDYTFLEDDIFQFSFPDRFVVPFSSEFYDIANSIQIKNGDMLKNRNKLLDTMFNYKNKK